MNTLKTLIVLLLCLSLTLCLVACGTTKSDTESEPLSGGWSTDKPAKLSDEQKALFAKATENYTGVSYSPVLYLGSQVVAGYNHRILCKAQAVYPGAAESWAIVEIYEDPAGNAEITNVTELSDEEAAQYGVSTESSGNMQLANPFVDCESFDAAAKLAGFSLTAPEAVDGYPNRLIQAVDGKMIQVFYATGDMGDESSEDVLLRKALGSEDISGDYNEYASVSTQDVGGRSVTLKGDGKLVYLAVWTDGAYSFSAAVSNGADADFILALVKGLN